MNGLNLARESMIWQDLVISVGQAIFAISLIPMVISQKEKPPLSTSFPTATVCGIYALTFGTLGLWWSVFSSSVICLLWSILVIQKIRQNRNTE